jgi:type IV pilus assembly protein PilW
MKNQRGYTIIEIFISLAIGLALFAGILLVFVGMKTTTQETATYGELQENGRFALSVLTDDLLRQNFWGDYTGTLDLAMLNSVPAAPGNECKGGGVNNGTFPVAASHFRTLWGETVADDGTSVMDCIDDAKAETDIIQFKRAISDPITAVSNNKYYIVSNLNEATIFNGTEAIPVITNSQLWEYQHRLYYIKEEAQGDNKVPVLMQGRLTNQMTFDPIIDGIEYIRFMYGIDTDAPTAPGYGIVDTFLSADNMTNAHWDHGNNNRILAIRIYVLARSILPDSKYTNNNTYNLGDFSFTPEAGDHYRRLLFNSTINLYNSGVDSW